ncbi:MAG: DUF4102 domain-containing protein [Aquabacterium sp.]|jgi:hypothetical protein|nr:DUF4102 domain-containing protein [Aquabacterium sp.]MDQ5926300.1 hypothetical protein [Pseudomonadota bacterium]
MLTDPACKNAVCPPDKPRIRLSDAGGLYLEVTPNGSKRWFAKYRFDGKEKRLALGSYPGVTLRPSWRHGNGQTNSASDSAKQSNGGSRGRSQPAREPTRERPRHHATVKRAGCGLKCVI